MKEYAFRAFALAFFLSATTVHAGWGKLPPGAVDKDFNSSDPGWGSGDGTNDEVSDLLLQDNGRILMGGDFRTYNGATANRIARIYPDGSLDKSFQSGIQKEINKVNKLAFQDDGKILVVGDESKLLRLQKNGEIDKTFFEGNIEHGHIHALAVTPDGKILLGGEFRFYNKIDRKNMVRLNRDGSIDQSFIWEPEKAVYAIANNVGGQVLVAGSFSEERIVRLDVAGLPDATFAATKTFSQIHQLIPDSEGRLLVVGRYGGVSCTSGVVRLNSSGQIDETFSKICLSEASKMDVGKKGHLYILDGQRKLLEFDANGTPVVANNIGFDGHVRINDLVYSSGKLYIATDSSYYYDGRNLRGVMRLTSDGKYDDSFNQGGGANDEIQSVSALPDGKIVISGNFRKMNGAPAVAELAWLESNGRTRPNFQPALVSRGDSPFVIAQSDGKLLVAGHFRASDGKKADLPCILRLLPDGSLDSTFSYKENFCPKQILIQSDGKIVVTGKDMGFFRLHADGSRDDSFRTGAGANDEVLMAAIQSDGRIVLVGRFTKYDGFVANNFARINSDGSFDASFKNAEIYNLNTAKDIFIQNDGRLLLRASFSKKSNPGINGYLLRLNRDGSIDNSFSPLRTSEGPFVVQADGKLLVCVQKNDNEYKITRFNTDGSIDLTFVVDETDSLKGHIFDMAITPDGFLLLVGRFTNYGNHGANRMVRVSTGDTDCDGIYDAIDTDTSGACR